MHRGQRHTLAALAGQGVVPATSTGWSAGSQASAKSTSTWPNSSRTQVAREKKRWKTEMWRLPTAPEASATPVIVRRPRQWAQPATIRQKFA